MLLRSQRYANKCGMMPLIPKLDKNCILNSLKSFIGILNVYVDTNHKVA